MGKHNTSPRKIIICERVINGGRKRDVERMFTKCESLAIELTKRQIEILKLWLLGWRQQDIANRLKVSQGCVSLSLSGIPNYKYDIKHGGIFKKIAKAYGYHPNMIHISLEDRGKTLYIRDEKFQTVQEERTTKPFWERSKLDDKKPRVKKQTQIKAKRPLMEISNE